MKTRISGKEAVQVAEDMAKPGPIRVIEPGKVPEAPDALVPSAGSELDRKVPPRVRKPLPRNDQWKAPTADLEGHRKRLREALGNTLSDEFVDVILGKLVEALRPGLYDQLDEATLNAALATIDSMRPRSELQAILAVQIIATGFAGLRFLRQSHRNMTECKTNCPCTSAGGVERGQGTAALAGQRRCRTAAAGCTAGCPRAPRRVTQMLSSTDTIRLKQSRVGARLRSCYGTRGLL